MKEVKFDEIWDKIIIPKIESLKTKHRSLTINANSKEAVRNRYQDQNRLYHDYMHDATGRLDRHKVSALFVDAILYVEPFQDLLKIEKGSQIQTQSFERELANEFLAWFAGTSIMKSFLVERLRRLNQPNTQRDISEKWPREPEVEAGSISYSDQIIRNLYISKVKKTFDFFTYSHVFFLLVRVHLEMFENERLSYRT